MKHISLFGGDRPPDTQRTPGRSWSRRALTLATVGVLPLAGITGALAATGVSTPNTATLAAVGPVNSSDGFPSWYSDGTTRLELCTDGSTTLCGALAPEPGQYDPSQPVHFPDNFPSEAFYQLASTTVPLGTGRAVVNLNLEAAFANGAVRAGDQMVFARQRIFVTGGPKDTTITFKEPYGTITVDTDADGNGRFTQDTGITPGAFAGALSGGIAPFLHWTPDPTLPAGYIGNPDVAHTVTGGIGGQNSVDASWPAGTSGAPAGSSSIGTWTLVGKIATNTGVQADSAVVNGQFLDVFATSEAGAGMLEVVNPAGGNPIPMLSDGGATGKKTFYARINLGSTPAPTSVTVRNLGDNPVSTSAVNVTVPTGITISSATYDGTTLRVAAASASGKALTLTPSNTPLTGGVASVATVAPPATVTVTDGTGSVSAPVQVTSGTASPAGQTPVTPTTTAAGPVCYTSATNTGPTVPCTSTTGGVATPTVAVTPNANIAAQPRAGTTPLVLDGSGSTNATAYSWTQVSGTPVTITNGTTARATVVPKLVDKPTTKPGSIDNGPAVIRLTVTNGSKSATTTVSVPIMTDAVAITRASFTPGSDFRIVGTATLPNGQLVLNPGSTIWLYDTASGAFVGQTTVDTTGAWSYRVQKPPSNFVSPKNVIAVSSRGGMSTSTAVAGA